MLPPRTVELQNYTNNASFGIESSLLIDYIGQIKMESFSLSLLSPVTLTEGHRRQERPDKRGAGGSTPRAPLRITTCVISPSWPSPSAQDVTATPSAAGPGTETEPWGRGGGLTGRSPWLPSHNLPGSLTNLVQCRCMELVVYCVLL